MTNVGLYENVIGNPGRHAEYNVGLGGWILVQDNSPWDYTPIPLADYAMFGIPDLGCTAGMAPFWYASTGWVCKPITSSTTTTKSGGTTVAKGDGTGETPGASSNKLINDIQKFLIQNSIYAPLPNWVIVAGLGILIGYKSSQRRVK